MYTGVQLTRTARCVTPDSGRRPTPGLLYLGHPRQEPRVPERAPVGEVASYLE